MIADMFGHTPQQLGEVLEWLAVTERLSIGDDYIFVRGYDMQRPLERV